MLYLGAAALVGLMLLIAPMDMQLSMLRTLLVCSAALLLAARLVVGQVGLLQVLKANVVIAALGSLIAVSLAASWRPASPADFLLPPLAFWLLATAIYARYLETSFARAFFTGLLASGLSLAGFWLF